MLHALHYHMPLYSMALEIRAIRAERERDDLQRKLDAVREAEVRWGPLAMQLLRELRRYAPDDAERILAAYPAPRAIG